LRPAVCCVRGCPYALWAAMRKLRPDVCCARGCPWIAVASGCA